MAGAPIRLRSGVRLVEGEPSYNDISCVFNRHYLIDETRHQTCIRLSKRQALTLLGKSVMPTCDVNDFKSKLEKNHLLYGQTQPPKPSGSPDQKLLFTAIPLPFKPDRFVGSWSWLGRALFNAKAIVVLAGLFIIALLLLSHQFNEFKSFTVASFSVEYLMANALEFGLAFVLVRVFHEMGHALACKKAGGYVEGFVITFIAGAPLPSTKMNMLHKASRRERLWIALAGIYMELWISVIAIFGWIGADTEGAKAMWHFLAVINPMMTISANMLPLMKFDGYYAWTAISRNPMLIEMATSQLRNSIYKILGFATTTRNLGLWYASILPTYGLAVLIWKVAILPISMMTGISLFLGGDRSSYLFIVMAAIIFWGKPLIKEVSKLKQAQYSFNPISLIPSLLLLTLMVWLVVPFDHIDEAQGAVAHERTTISAPVDAMVSFVVAKGLVTEGDKLLELSDLSADAKRGQLTEKYKIASYGSQEAPYLQLAKLRAANAENNLLDKEAVALSVMAQSDGFWSPVQEASFAKGAAVGELVNLNSALLNAYVPKSITTKGKIKALVVFENGKRIETTLTKLSEVTLTNSAPKFILASAGGALSEDKPIHPLQRYVTTLSGVTEGRVTVYLKTRYSIAGRYLRKIKARAALL